MNPGGFSFPPPPPPPPPTQHTSGGFPNNAQQHSSRGRGGRGSGSHHRGRGRGGGRGGNRGGYMNGAPAANYRPPPPSPQTTYPYHGMGTSPTQYNLPASPHATAYPPSTYGQPHPSPQFPSPRSPFSPLSPQYPPQVQHQYPAQPPAGYPSQIGPPTILQPPRNFSQHASPQIASPPIHWGFDRRSGSQTFTSQHNYTSGPPHTQRQSQERRSGYAPHQRNTNAQHGPGGYHAGDNNHNHRMNKRAHSAAFGSKPHEPRPAAPLPVPSFGNPLPSKPPTMGSSRPGKKRRKYNQLGLTPKTEEHESSEEEDDADEEERLGSLITAHDMKVTYRGQTATLQSADDIAAWIEERRKRFPTAARVEARKKELKEKQAAVEAARKAKQEEQEKLRKQNAARTKQGKEKAKSKGSPTNKALGPVDAAEKAKLKAEKLRRKLMKEEERVAKAEAAVAKARQAVEALASQINGTAAEGAEMKAHEGPANGEVSNGDNALREANGNGVTSVSGGEAGTPRAFESQTNNAGEISADLSSEISNLSDDETSSSGSDSSSDSSSGDDEDGAPEQMSSRRERPERVLPPARKQRAPCRTFLKTGRCGRGNGCSYSHEITEKTRARNKDSSRGGRRPGLFHALVERQNEDESRRVMQAISWLGEKGMLEPRTKSEVGKDGRKGSNDG